MKKLFLVASIMGSLFFVGCESEEEENDKIATQIALYDKNKESIAYIDYEDRDDKELATIYMYDGTPVAYLYESYINEGANIYGFNGLFMGWYINGVVYDREGYAVGAKQGILRIGINTNITRPERGKNAKKIKPVKHVRSVQPVCPLLKDNWSETSLSDFLLLTSEELVAFSPEHSSSMYINGLYNEEQALVKSIKKTE
ncbi:MAG: 4-fold beta flower protein [Flavobacteriaceae bacterium]